MKVVFKMIEASILFKFIMYIVSGFLFESLITSYHRCVYNEKNISASILAALITIVSLIALSNATKEMLAEDNKIGYIYVLMFALGKGFGAFVSLYIWSKKRSR